MDFLSLGPSLATFNPDSTILVTSWNEMTCIECSLYESRKSTQLHLLMHSSIAHVVVHFMTYTLYTHRIIQLVTHYVNSKEQVYFASSSDIYAGLGCICTLSE